MELNQRLSERLLVTTLQFVVVSTAVMWAVFFFGAVGFFGEAVTYAVCHVLWSFSRWQSARWWRYEGVATTPFHRI